MASLSQEGRHVDRVISDDSHDGSRGFYQVATTYHGTPEHCEVGSQQEHYSTLLLHDGKNGNGSAETSVRLSFPAHPRRPFAVIQ